MMLRRMGIVLVAVVLLSVGGPASAATGCWGGVLPDGGCVNVTNGTNDPLWVHSMKAGVASENDHATRCGNFEAGKISPAGYFSIIHISARKCVNPYHNPTWGPTWIQDQRYADGTQLGGRFTGFHPDRWAWVTIHD